MPKIEHLLLPAEVAAMCGVRRHVVQYWARSGKLPALRTVGGHRRYREADVQALLGAHDADQGCARNTNKQRRGHG